MHKIYTALVLWSVYLSPTYAMDIAISIEETFPLQKLPVPIQNRIAHYLVLNSESESDETFLKRLKNDQANFNEERPYQNNKNITITCVNPSITEKIFFGHTEQIVNNRHCFLQKKITNNGKEEVTETVWQKPWSISRTLFYYYTNATVTQPSFEKIKKFTFSPNHKHIALLLSWDKQIINRWDNEANFSRSIMVYNRLTKQHKEISLNNSVGGPIAINNDGTLVAFARNSDSNKVFLWDITERDAEQIYKNTNKDDPITKIAFNTQGTKLAILTEQSQEGLLLEIKKEQKKEEPNLGEYFAQKGICKHWPHNTPQSSGILNRIIKYLQTMGNTNIRYTPIRELV